MYNYNLENTLERDQCAKNTNAYQINKQPPHVFELGENLCTFLLVPQSSKMNAASNVNNKNIYSTTAAVP